MIALLVVTVVPMTVTAEPSSGQGTSRITYPLLMQGTAEEVGSITIGHQRAHGYGYSLTALLEPITSYKLHLLVGFEDHALGTINVRAQGQGHIHIRGTLPTLTDQQYNQIMTGDAIFGVEPLPS